MPIKPLVRTNAKAKKAEPAAPKKTAAAPAAKAASKPSIDFPVEGELVLPGHYAVRVSAPEGSGPEISTDGKQWNACRPAVGYFWFDWWPSAKGRVTLQLRLKANGKWTKVAERGCSVVGN
ncbi:MAG: hypothetical protein JO102_02190, partial [Elusimicrobia bacterium]|nr:hypothetical protein [Elusimicrobiota bacterium]